MGSGPLHTGKTRTPSNPAARERVEDLGQRNVAYAGALEQIHRQITAHAEALAEEYDADVRRKAEEQLAEVEAATSHLQSLCAGLQVLGGLAEWIERPTKSFSYRPPESGPFAAILEEARGCQAFPQERRVETLGIAHPGHSAPRGLLRPEYEPFRFQ